MMTSEPDERAAIPENVHYIDDRQALQSICAQFAQYDVLAVDTEFVREKTYFPKLCLIQIASHDLAACIDPLVLDDLSPLRELLDNANIKKIFHAARQDLEILKQDLGIIPSPIFDTQIAATLLGLGEQLSYAHLVNHFLKVQVDKGQSRTDWELRPLAQEQISYAADDVRYLIGIYPMMLAELNRLGRLDWLEEDFRAITEPALYEVNPQEQWQRVSGVQKLRGVQLAILQALAAWREEQAIKSDKPRKWILPDNILLAIAMQNPRRRDQLERIRGLNSSIFDKHGDTILALLEQARALPASAWPVTTRRRKLDTNQEAVLDAVMAIIKLCAAQQQLNTSALGSRQDVEALVAEHADIPLLHGWRKGLAGQAVLDFLAGKRQLHISDSRLTLLNG